MNKYLLSGLTTLAAGLLASMSAFALSMPKLPVLNSSSGSQLCQREYPTKTTCFPIHLQKNVNQNAAIMLYYKAWPGDYFYLTPNESGAVSLSLSKAQNQQAIVIYAATIRGSELIRGHKIYTGNLGPNKTGLSCNSTHCFIWV